MTYAGTVNFDTDKVRIRLVCRHYHQAGAIAKTDFECDRGCPPEKLQRLDFSFNRNSILGPECLQRPLLPGRQSSLAAYEGANTLAQCVCVMFGFIYDGYTCIARLYGFVYRLSEQCNGVAQPSGLKELPFRGQALEKRPVNG